MSPFKELAIDLEAEPGSLDHFACCTLADMRLFRILSCAREKIAMSRRGKSPHIDLIHCSTAAPVHCPGLFYTLLSECLHLHKQFPDSRSPLEGFEVDPAIRKVPILGAKLQCLRYAAAEDLANPHCHNDPCPRLRQQVLQPVREILR